MRLVLGRALGRSVRDAADPQTRASLDLLRVDLAFRPRGIATVRATLVRAGAATSYPEAAIARSDRPLGPDIVDALARDLATAIARADALRKN